MIGISPGAVSWLDLARRCKTVVRQLDFAYAIYKQIAFAVFADDMSGIDTSLDVQVNRIAPRPFDRVSPDHVNGPGIAVGSCGNIDEIAALMLAEINCPNASKWLE